jgi:hypothetical protein
MNTSMFLPQVAENDVYDKSGNQVDDINSVVEYVYEVVLGHKAVNPTDEDDDNGQNFNVVRAGDFYCQQPVLIITDKEFLQKPAEEFGTYIDNKTATISFDILTPPPEG